MPKTNDRVLVINLGWEQQPLIEEVMRQGYRVVGIHADGGYAAQSRLADVEVADYRDLPRILEVARRIKPVAVVSDECDYAYFATAAIAAQLGLPGPCLAAAQVATNKWLQRRIGEQQGVLQPRYALCTNLEEAQQAARDIGFPVVIKPIDNRGSFGVNRVADAEGTETAYIDALMHAHSRLVLVEEFIEGVHITIDGYCFPRAGHRSLGLATKGMLGGARQVAVEIIYPGELPVEVYRRALANNDRVVAAMGFRYGMTHAEYMIDPEGRAYLIEIANRGGGVFTSAKIVPAVSGIDITRQLVLDSLGSGQDLFMENAGTAGGAAYLKFFVLSPGLIESIAGLDEARALAGVEALRLQVGAGDLVQDTTTDASRHGFVITRGRTREDVRAVARAVEQQLEVNYA